MDWSLTGRLKMAAEAEENRSDISKADFPKEIIKFYKSNDTEGMKGLYEAFHAFMSKEGESPKNTARARGSLDVMCHATDLIQKGLSVDEAIDKAMKTPKNLRPPSDIRRFYYNAIGYEIDVV